MAAPAQLNGWLWRVPFLLGALLILVAVYIRRKLKESPTFEVLSAEGVEPEQISLGEAIRTSRKNILLGIGLRMAENGNSSIYSALLLAFIGTMAAYKGANIGPIGASVAAVVSVFTVVFFGNAHRYTGVAMAREISAVLAGGIAPLVGAAMLAASGNAWWTIGLYSMVLNVISFVTTFFTPEPAGRSLTDLADAGAPLR